MKWRAISIVVFSVVLIFVYIMSITNKQGTPSENLSTQTNSVESVPIRNVAASVSLVQTVSNLPHGPFASAPIHLKDEAQLLESLTTIEFTNRRPIIDDLALVGSDAAAKAMIADLTANYGGRLMPLEECSILVRTIHCLGYISTRSRVALEFLIDRTNPSAWDASSIWMESGFDTIKDYQSYLAGCALAALGAGARPEMWRELNRIQGSDMDLHEAKRWHAMFIDATFNENLQQRFEASVIIRMSGTAHFGQFVQWRKQNHNTEIDQWYENKTNSIHK